MQTFLNGRVIVKVGDLTEEHVDAIVNAANSTLLGGGGVDGAIHAKGGREIVTECRKIQKSRFPTGLPYGLAVITTGGNLRAKHVIHTVGPMYGKTNGQDAKLLADCYRNSLALAVETGLSTIAFPAISTGVYGYPKAEAALVASDGIRVFLETDESIKEIRFVFHTDEDARVFLDNTTFVN